MCVFVRLLFYFSHSGVSLCLNSCPCLHLSLMCERCVKTDLHLPLDPSHSTSINYCPHLNYLLHWFPLNLGSPFHEVCFVPFANLQAITFARCT